MLHCKIGDSVPLGVHVNVPIVCVLRLNTDDFVNGIACNQLGRRGLVERVCPRNVVIISKDEALSQAFKPHAHISCCRQFKRNDVQSLLRRLDRGAAFSGDITSSTARGVCRKAAVTCAKRACDWFTGLRFIDPPHIIGFGECGVVKAEFSQPIYFGTVDIGLEFELDVVVDVSFDIFKVDYFSLRHKPRIMAEYEHHVRVKDRSIARVKGVALIPFCLDYLAARNKGERLPHQTIKISSIDDVALRNYTLAQVYG
ncbi:hypothetical protein [Vibrio brasiliensis]|uniref:hypothetical protein n=1 Tax=Vibrio brasiliensis TaxID=170652 RepID=UPI001EFDCBE6|nr:hypothetical protein [Vibrio brasiliensis]MCG9727414.1 hypothetical protein [Vibrio brasiliensis]